MCERLLYVAWEDREIFRWKRHDTFSTLEHWGVPMTKLPSHFEPV